MIRPIFAASILALAVPAIAQNTTQDDMNKPAPTEGIASPDAQDQTAPNMASAATPNRDADDDTEATTDHSQMNHGTRPGTTATPGQSGTMSGNSSMMGDKGNRPAGMNSSQSNSGSMSNNGSMGVGTNSSGYTGMGGPTEPRNYPMCSRTITDSCMQAPGRRSRPRR